LEEGRRVAGGGGEGREYKKVDQRKRPTRKDPERRIHFLIFLLASKGRQVNDLYFLTPSSSFKLLTHLSEPFTF